MAEGQSLTALEASFLAVERPGLPMHVAGVVIFDASTHVGGPVTMTSLRRLVASRLRRLPRFGQCVRFSAFGLHRPEWVDAGKPDLDHHLFHHLLPVPGGRRQMTDLCARIHEQLLPRDQPLWEIHLVDGLEDEHQALIVKTHHSITDGIAGIELAELLFDTAPHLPRTTRGTPTLRFAGTGNGSGLAPLQSGLGLAVTAAGGPIVPMGPFNGPVGAERSFAIATLRMKDVRRLKQRLGGSVDDVFLAVVATGLNHYFRQLRYPDQPKTLRAMLPVSTRPSSDRVSLGNQVTAVFVDLPLDAADPAALLRTIAASKSLLRTTHAAKGMSLLIEAAGRLPNPLHDAVVRFAGDLVFANLVLSDVPGPDEPLLVMGRRIAACYPMIPLPSAIGLSIAAISMGGTMGVGVVTDPDLVPKPEELAKAIERAIYEIEKFSVPRRSSHLARRHTQRAA